LSFKKADKFGNMSKDKSVEEINDQEKEQVEQTTTNDNLNGDTATEDQSGTEEKDEVAKLSEEVGKLKDQHLRLFAEFENYKKRTSKERVELFSSANQELMDALIPILDDFTRALKSIEGTEAEEGVKLIYNKLESTLKNKGLKPMENTTGKEFDVDTMEAITRIPAPSDDQKGKVIDEIERGYYLGNKILRYAKVVVGE